MFIYVFDVFFGFILVRLLLKVLEILKPKIFPILTSFSENLIMIDSSRGCSLESRSVSKSLPIIYSEHFSLLLNASGILHIYFVKFSWSQFLSRNLLIGNSEKDFYVLVWNRPLVFSTLTIYYIVLGIGGLHIEARLSISKRTNQPSGSICIDFMISTMKMWRILMSVVRNVRSERYTSFVHFSKNMVLCCSEMLISSLSPLRVLQYGTLNIEW